MRDQRGQIGKKLREQKNGINDTMGTKVAKFNCQMFASLHQFETINK